MNKPFVWLLATLLLGTGTTFGQVFNVPQKAKDHFSTTYANAKKPDWKNHVTNYTITFTMGSHKYKAYYKMDGDWDFTVKYIKSDELPPQVKEAVAKSRIGNWKPVSEAFIETHKGIKEYRIERKKGVEQLYLFFDESGKEINSSITF